MMVLFFAAFAVLCLVGIKFKPADGAKFMPDYMSVEKTMSVKGIFIILVFFSHFNSYVTYTAPLDTAYLSVFRHIGQCMVTLFLFYSGYGVMESVSKKGISYVHKIPVTRVLGTFFRFDVAVLLFAVVCLVFSRPFTASQFALSLVGWDSLGNSNWYVFAILVAYIVTFVSFELCHLVTKKMAPAIYKYSAVVLVSLGCMLYIYVLAHFKLKDGYWYDTIICYALGMWYSLLRDKIEKIVNHNIFVYLIFFLATGACTAYFAMNRGVSFVHTELCMIFFTAFVVLLTMRVSVHNKVLMWCGKNLFGLYILQRIPMIVFRELGVADFNIYLYFVLCLIVTVPLAWLFEKYVGKLWKIISTSKKKTA